MSFFEEINSNNRIGYILILLGIATALGILIEICAIFNDPNHLIDFSKLFTEKLIINLSKDNIIIPSEILAYLLPVILLSIASGIASALISGGVALVRKQSKSSSD
jgi:hypothetical protein